RDARRPHGVGGPFLSRDHRPGDGRGPARGRERRARDHLAHQGRHARDPLPHARPHPPHAGHRAHHASHGARHGQERRHAHHPRRQRVSLADRGDPPLEREARAPLPARGAARGPPGRPRRPGRATTRFAGCDEDRARARCRAPHEGNDRRGGPRPHRRAGRAAALAGQGGARRRQEAESLMDAPRDTGDFARDCERYSRYWESAAARLAKLPQKPSRRQDEAREAEAILHEARELRGPFLAAHASAVYDRLTGNRSRFVRVEDLVYNAAALVPGLVPTREQVDAESSRAQRDKDGIEIDQGIFVSAVLADAASGRHLCHAMLLPRAESLERLAELKKRGRVDLGAAEVTRKGNACYVVQKNPRHLNAEDDTTLDAAEIATDLAILDPDTSICVLRGDVVQSGKFSGRRVLGSGINLTHLYHGKVPFVWYLKRDLGVVNKIYRGLASEDSVPDDVGGRT